MECKTCGNSHPEEFCPACGEKTFDVHQLSLKHFIEETFEGFAHFDSKFFRTVKLLLTKPGQLSVDFSQGRRVKYMKPIPFFLVMNLIFFILPFRNMYTQGLDTYTTFSSYQKYNTVAIVQKELARTKLSLVEYRQIFNEKIKGLSKELIFIYIPFYGLIFAILFFYQRRYFVEHLVFATHFMAFILLLGLLTAFFITIPFAVFSHSGFSPVLDQVLGYVFITCISAYAAAAIRRFYKPHMIWTLITAIGIGFTFLPLMQYYRMLLFYEIIYLH